MSIGRAWATVKEFADTTSFHGVKHAVTGSSSCRFVWSVSLVGCIVACSMQLLSLFCVYFSYQTSTTIQLALYEQFATASDVETAVKRKKRYSAPCFNCSVDNASASANARNETALRRRQRGTQSNYCPSGFIEYFQMCHYVDPHKLLDYAEAKQFCTDIGARLPVLRGMLWANFGQYLKSQFGTIERVYLGMDDIDGDGEYKMHDSEGSHRLAVLTYSTQDFHMKPCMILITQHDIWQVQQCTHKYPIVCQAPTIMEYTTLNGYLATNSNDMVLIPSVDNFRKCMNLCMNSSNCNMTGVILDSPESLRCFHYYDQQFQNATELGGRCLSIRLSEKACSFVGYVTNGNIPIYDTLLTTVGTKVTFSCLAGFTLIGSPTTSCLTGGVWSDSNPTCKNISYVSCPALNLGPDIVVTYSMTDLTYVASFSCSAANSQDFYIITPASSTCLHDGTWRLPLPPICTYVPEDMKPKLNELNFQLNQFKDENEALKLTMKDSLPYFSHLVTKQQLALIGHQLSGMVTSCTIDGVKCQAKDFKSRLDPAFGNCYTLNDENPPRVIANRAGVDQGILLELNVETHEYISLTDQAGMVVVVHDQNETIIPETVRYTVASGTSTAIAMQRMKIRRMQKPYSACEIDTTQFDNLFDTAYSAEGCFKSCQQKKLFAKCGCGDPRIPLPTDSEHCNIQDIDCVSEFYATQSDVACNCPETCHSTALSMVASQLKWYPSEMVKNMHCDQSSENQSSCIRQITRNKLYLQIYFNNIQQTIYSEHPMSSLVQLMSGLGGSLALFIGPSVLTFVELITLIVGLIYGCFKR